LRAYRKAEQVSETDFAQLDGLAFKLENGLLKLIDVLKRKQLDGDWIDHSVVKERNTA